jgi:hypothetical protein
MYFNNLNKQYEKNVNLKITKASNTKEEKISKEYDTINNFTEFYTGTSNNIVFNDIEVNNSEIKLGILTEDKNIFNDIVNTLEHSSKYKIKYLSPIDENNNKYSFKITLEVQK